VREAKRLSIPVVGLIDTNSDPDLVAFPVPGNDDATRSIKMITSLIADSIIEGRKRFLSYLSQEGVALKDKGESAEGAAVLPEEEQKIKEIEEIVEGTEPSDEEAKPAKKGRARPAQGEGAKTRKKV
jgi:small subunit ribosomal protein S2